MFPNDIEFSKFFIRVVIDCHIFVTYINF